MSSFRFTLAAGLAAVFGGSLCAPVIAEEFPENPLGWPAVKSIQKPWTRWWWLGSAVDRPNITRQLEDFAKAGLGGVEICPIYGAIGAEDRFLKFLSPEWMSMLGHTTSEAKRLGMGVDLTTGTGWPFGGSMVTAETASANLQMVRGEAHGGVSFDLTLPKGNLLALAAYPDDGEPVHLSGQVKDSKLTWMPPAGNWKILGIVSESPIQKVKRAAPGGEGNVLDPFSAKAMQAYLTSFDKAFEKFASPLPRAHFHDSFEYYGAAWTPSFLADFQKARGYDLLAKLPAFSGIGDADTVARVRADYRETLDELHLGYLQTWHDWAKKHNSITRNQAHGSPGNLLDHYAVSEIPETEIFRHVDEDQIPMLRFPVSAANSNGGALVSAETFTWLDEHFQVTPRKLKEAADFVFLGGVNHIFFHGIPYTPSDAPWPGWLFYASTHMGPNGGLWRDLPTFNAYIQRCQSVLQEGKPTSQMLIYYPIHDLWHHDGEKLPLFTVHDQDKWLQPTTFYQTSMDLWNKGVTFDYASDRMLANATVKDGRIVLGANSFSALVLPGVKHLQPKTLKQILNLTKMGAKLIIQNGWPSEVPGYHQQKERREALHALRPSSEKNIIECSGSIIPSLSSSELLQEHMTELGMRFVRRTHSEGYHYFIVNRSEQIFDGFLPLAVPMQSAVVLDPWATSRSGVVLPQSTATGSGLNVRLEPGQSIIIRTYTRRKIEGPTWTDFPGNAKSLHIEGPWKIEFLEGGPVLPKPEEMSSVAFWTSLTGSDISSFSGTAKYSTSFHFEGAEKSQARLELGKVAETARVYLNGRYAGTSWCPPHAVDLTGFLKTGKNQLDIEVTNLAANRIADLDRRKIKWKQFHEINFVNIDYKLFDASNWPVMDSGLAGPVRLMISVKD
jgi:hypothetical protein